MVPVGIRVCIISNQPQSWLRREADQVPGLREKGFGKDAEEGVCLGRLAWNKHAAWLKCIAECGKEEPVSTHGPVSCMLEGAGVCSGREPWLGMLRICVLSPQFLHSDLWPVVPSRSDHMRLLLSL